MFRRAVNFCKPLFFRNTLGKTFGALPKFKEFKMPSGKTQFLFGSLIGASLVRGDEDSRALVRDLKKVTHEGYYPNEMTKEVLNDLGYTADQAFAIMAIFSIFSHRSYDLDFLRECDIDLRYVTEKSEALEILSKYFSSENFKESISLSRVYGHDHSIYTESEQIGYSKFPTSDSLENRNEKLLKIAKILDIPVKNDIGCYDKNVLTVARHIEKNIKEKYLKLNEAYESVDSILARRIIGFPHR